MNYQLLLVLSLTQMFLSLTISNDKWKSEKFADYTVFYTPEDKNNLEEYLVYFENGKKSVASFFQNSYSNTFSIYIHPNRASLDSTWQKDWNMPDFKSQCWMVASGISDKLDIISPKLWDSIACEHRYSNTSKTQNLITHELVHVFHGQLCASPDFSNVTGIDWFLEGMATYASGQCDSNRVSEVKKAILDKNIPETLDTFWSGNLRYGLSGTVVMYLDSKYGREKLTRLLRYNNISEILNSLETTESEIINEWKNYMKEL